jgi:hypothetical protein
VIPRTVLVVASPFPGPLGATLVAGALTRGLKSATGSWHVDSWMLEHPAGGLDELGRTGAPFAARLHAARALVLAAEDLWGGGAAGSGAVGLATDARQGGIPAYAVTAAPETYSFGARILDLQTVLHATTERELQAAGETLAGLIFGYARA